MSNYENKKLIHMPEPKPYHKMTDKELQNLLKANINYNVLIPVLIEINLRQNMEILSLKKRISTLETKTLKKPGRKRTTYYLHGKKLTDEELIYYIDYDYFTISELERGVGAPMHIPLQTVLRFPVVRYAIPLESV